MRSRRRILAVSLAALSAFVFGVLLLSLRLGRPLYYSDGARPHAGAQLSQGSMLEFGDTTVLAELPGEIVGRAARLPDGRWIYGIRRTKDRVDLVAVDPGRPGLAPDVLEELNSEGVDFAPAMGPGPALYFASDRVGGEGGLDLYRSEWREGSFGPVEALRSGINSMADESDPAPARAGPLAGSLVFVRQGPQTDHAELCVSRLDGDEDARLLYPDRALPAWHAMSRDPIFDASGQSLYFVRQGREGVSLLRTALHQGRFLEPWTPAGLGQRADWRSPLPGERGSRIDLLRPGKPNLVYRAEAEERIVFWKGQEPLERWLLSGLLFSTLLVLLITLGGRWSRLDLLTKLLLLSLLVHGLILLWMSHIDILTRDEQEGDPAGAIQVEILSAESDTQSGEGRREFEPLEALTFEGKQAQILARAPIVGLAAAEPHTSFKRRGEVLVVLPDSDVAMREVALSSDSIDAPKPILVQETPGKLETEADPVASRAAPRIGPSQLRAESSEGPALAVRFPSTGIASIQDRAERRVQPSRALALPGPTEQPRPEVAIRDGRAGGHGRGASPERSVDDETTRSLSEGAIAKGLSVGPAAPATASPGRPSIRERAEDNATTALSTEHVPASVLARPARRSRRRSADSRVSSATREDRLVVEPVMKDPVHTGKKRVSKSVSLPRAGASPTLAPLERGAYASASPPAHDPLAEAKTSAAEVGTLSPPGTLVARAPRTRHRSEPRIEKPDPGVFRNRFGQARVAALRRFGGTQKTEAAVRSGLAYLALVQKEDGSWGNKTKIDAKYGETFVGKTGLCLLAFLGAGHVPGNGHAHSSVSRKAMEFLLYVQDEETGHFGLSSAYSHGISTYALAECYALCKDKRLRGPLEAAVDWILENQNASRDRRQDGGWGYYSPTLRREDAYARTSVSSWQVMALLSAQKAGLPVPNQALQRARRFFSSSYDRRRGYFLYSRQPSRLRSQWRTLPASTPASVFSLLLLGEKVDSDRIVGGLEFTLTRRPRAYRWRGDNSFVTKAEGNTYFWYYGSLACFLAGGDTWKRWNQALVDVLPRAQLGDGSFRPLGPYARYAGDDLRDRSYTTAMCVLSLEVYYRYFTPLLEGRH